MVLEVLAIDIGKRSFHLHGVDADGVVISRRVGRAKLAGVVDQLAPRIVAMEACASAHHWGRLFQSGGREVRLIHPHFVRPFVRGSKNDAVDAEAVWDAATRPTMRFVPVKTTEQQDLQCIHRIRDRLVQNRTALINHTRGLLAEYGVVLPKGAKRFTSIYGRGGDRYLRAAGAGTGVVPRTRRPTRGRRSPHRQDRREAGGDLQGARGLPASDGDAGRGSCRCNRARGGC